MVRNTKGKWVNFLLENMSPTRKRLFTLDGKKWWMAHKERCKFYVSWNGERLCESTDVKKFRAKHEEIAFRLVNFLYNKDAESFNKGEEHEI